ncbi:hypothetical protein [Streptomyces clavifer]|uniref:Uncharacterized protein n=2 Tax=Streptomyces TaxID=1883 RepID=A0ABS4VB69_9ACTN|nr:hypothetical protein [Streptomyces clavifer]MBP2361168.1 hypothetical protein [Streptomyces clavifer]WUC28061.1 hypothetical protein OG927_12105 [Streptomyces clavifer]GHA94839.1 hypothetical protein GCM10010392_21920 [Streptomyces clavifer]
MSTVYAYPTLAGKIEITVRGASMDGKPLQLSLISQRDQVVALHQIERDDWIEGVLDLEVSLPSDELDEGPWSGVSCVAVLTEGATNTRVVSRLERRRGDTHWRGEVRVRRSMHAARALLDVSVVGSHGGVDGRVIGRTDTSWVVDLLARTPTRQRDLEILEKDFRDGPEEGLRRFADAPWLIDTTGDLPAVLINTSFEGLPELLSGARGPLEKATAGMVAAQIAGEAWATMFHAALSDLEFDEDGTPRFPGGWRESVLRSILPEVFPGLPLPEALAEAHSCRGDGRGWAEIQARIHYAAGKRGQVPKNLTATIRAVQRAQEGPRR